MTALIWLIVFIGAFEGIAEALARIGARTYACESVRRFTANAVDLGEKPSVAAAIAKYHVTTLARQVAVDAMDVHAAKAVMLGPSNPLARRNQYFPRQLWHRILISFIVQPGL